MIYLLSGFLNTLVPILIFLALFFASCFIILALLNLFRKLVYNSAMDYVTVQERLIGQRHQGELLAGLQREYRGLIKLSGDIEQRKNGILLDIGIIDKHKADIEIG